ncbi:MAG: hypothetical protein M3406_18330 [Chloroflexota bacterium]|nr:hypothetical protein [Chloroflexota bacterium]
MRSNLTTRAAVLAAIIAPVILAMAAVTPVTAVELTQQCTNPKEAYTVSLPRGWYYNETVEADDTDDVAACRFFSPEDFEVRPGSGVADVAIGIGREATAPRAEGQATTVGGKPAIVLETEANEDSFDPAGTHYYQYWIDIGDEWLVATTSDAPTWVSEYEDNKVVLDAMMGTLTFGTSSLPDTALVVPLNPWPAVVGGALLLLAAVVALWPAWRGA